jgi:hypothetical protein
MSQPDGKLGRILREERMEKCHFKHLFLPVELVTVGGAVVAVAVVDAVDALIISDIYNTFFLDAFQRFRRRL